MLPNRMQLNKNTEEQLKKLKTYTGLTPNVSARLAFFYSIESGYICNDFDALKLDGTLILDKITWLGQTAQVTELILKMKYPNIPEKNLVKAWASHVHDGTAFFRNHRNLNSLCEAIK